MLQTSDNRAWYKQFWPWFLIIIPLSSILLSFTMLHLAFSGEDSLVQDDYYNQGRAINLDLHKIEEAKRRQIETRISFKNGIIEMQVIQGQIDQGSALKLNFFHSTQDFKDFKLVLLKDAQGTYRAQTDQPLAGKWRISLQPQDEQWKIQQVVSLPQSEAVLFTP